MTRPQRSPRSAVHAGIPRLEPLEIHSGMIFGPRRSRAPSVETSPGVSSVRQVMEELLLPALSTPPCLVAFSGGRDSSAILAEAVGITRRHGLDDPVPLTLRFDQHPRTVETEWQELVVRHLGLRDWMIVPIQSELDILGPLARDTLGRHGLFWPANSHAKARLLRAAGAATLVTGTGGDEVFNSLVRGRKMSLRQMARSLPPRRALMTGLVSLLPVRWRIGVQYQKGLRFPWLRPAARREVRRLFREAFLQHRRNPRHYLETLDNSRYLELLRGIAGALARDAGVRQFEPFLDSRFFKAALSAMPDEGFPSRNAALMSFFGDVLPPVMAERTTKAVFTESFWGPESRAFATQWDGTGLDPSLVDPDRLRDHWVGPRPDLRSATALQAAWLASGNSPYFHT